MLFFTFVKNRRQIQHEEKQKMKPRASSLLGPGPLQHPIMHSNPYQVPQYSSFSTNPFNYRPPPPQNRVSECQIHKYILLNTRKLLTYKHVCIDESEFIDSTVNRMLNNAY